MPRILVVEDDAKTAQSLVSGFSAEGFNARIASNGQDALASVAAHPCDIIILDWMLPRRSGLEVLRALRERGNRVPVLVLTARDDIDDRVIGLQAGADD
jgi:two-component system, OmpR family, response regulator